MMLERWEARVPVDRLSAPSLEEDLEWLGLGRVSLIKSVGDVFGPRHSRENAATIAAESGRSFEEIWAQAETMCDSGPEQ